MSTGQLVVSVAVPVVTLVLGAALSYWASATQYERQRVDARAEREQARRWELADREAAARKAMLDSAVEGLLMSSERAIVLLTTQEDDSAPLVGMPELARSVVRHSEAISDARIRKEVYLLAGLMHYSALVARRSNAVRREGVKEVTSRAVNIGAAMRVGRIAGFLKRGELVDPPDEQVSEWLDRFARMLGERFPPKA